MSPFSSSASSSVKWEQDFKKLIGTYKVYYVTSPVAAPYIKTSIFFSNETYETWLQKSLSLVLSLFEFLPNLHTFDFQSFGDSGIVGKELWTMAAVCSYFLLILLPAVAQSVFKKLDSSGSHRVAIDVICLLFPAGNLLFLSCSTIKEKMRGKCVLSSLFGCLR